MIKSIGISNYQSHKETLIELCPNVNVIVGENNSGKTAIFRALNWLFFNRPTGGKMFHNYSGSSGDVHVTVETTEGNMFGLRKNVKIVNDKKTVRKSQYYLNESVFEGFGSQVPDVFFETLNISELNIQKQLEGPFLIASSPGEIARTLNRITNLDQSDEYIRLINQKINKSAQKMDLLESEAAELEVGLKEFEGLEEVEKKLTKLELIDVEIDDKHNKAVKILKYHDNIVYLEEQLAALPDLDNLNRKLARVESLDAQLSVLYEKVRLISELVNIEEFLEKLPDIEKLKELESRCDLLDNEIQEKKLELERIELYANTETVLRDTADLFAEHLHIFVDMLKEAKVCPLCSTKLTPEHMEEVIDEIRR